MPGHQLVGPHGAGSNQPLIDSGTMARTASPPGGPVGTQDGRQEFDLAYEMLRAQIANLGFTGAVDGPTRARYTQLLIEFRDDIQARVRSGRLTWQQAAQEAHALRGTVMDLLRGRSTPVGRAIAQWLKAENKSFNQLVGEKTVALFGQGADFAQLSPHQQGQVHAAIVQSAGKSSPRVNLWMRRASRAGRGLLVLSLGVSVYTIATADDKVDAAKHEGALMGGGIAGGVAGGALAGLACGPGAPVCVTVGAFVGGALAAMGVDYFWND
ncbi:hypothetical protein ACVNIS_10395 [Sphaerotilaceae bacterium SBD11-9]